LNSSGSGQGPVVGYFELGTASQEAVGSVELASTHIPRSRPCFSVEIRSQCSDALRPSASSFSTISRVFFRRSIVILLRVDNMSKCEL
jgi:hypothetical protein